MTQTAAHILGEALQLSDRERAELADHILNSLDKSLDSNIDALWAQECEGRLDAYERGQIEGISAEDLFCKKSKS